MVEALEAGLSVYRGRALVNSITAEDERMEQILPLVKKYDAAIIALPNDADEIPMEVEKRIVLTRKIIEVATKEYGIAAADIVIDPLAMPIGADRGGRQHGPGNDAPDPRGVRRQHDVRRLQRVVRDAGPARAGLGVPADGDDGGPHQRDHGHPHPGDRRGGQGRRPAPGPRRVGRLSDRGAPGTPGEGSSSRTVKDGPDFSLADVAREGLIERSRRRPGGPRRHRSCGPRLHGPQPRGGRCRGAADPARSPRPTRCHGLRRRVVERHRDRLDLRRPRHLSQVQGPGRGRRRADQPPRRAHLQPRAARRRLAARLPGAGHPRPDGRRAATDDTAEGGDRRHRAPGDPATRAAEALRRARGGDPLRPAHRPGPVDRRHRRPRADRRPARAAPAVDGAAPEPTSR
ncbi:dihydropteroate synthase [Nocardioides sp. B-3]|nr:dihydropteroate synthase [Nocardioides sp. B-3]UUZ60679.1 dihydropteroate synthase [Nocardioides sp. B-3]